MGDYRANPNINANYPQRPGPYPNRPGQGQSVSLGTPVNNATPNRSSDMVTVTAMPSNSSNPISNRQAKKSPIQKKPRKNNRPNTQHKTETIDNKSSVQNMESTTKTNVLHNTENKNPQGKTLTGSLGTLLDLSNMNSKDILKGIVFSEIIGKPKALRRGRW